MAEASDQFLPVVAFSAHKIHRYRKGRGYSLTIKGASLY